MEHTGIYLCGEERRNFGGGGGHSKCVKSIFHLDNIDSNEVIILKLLYLKAKSEQQLLL